MRTRYNVEAICYDKKGRVLSKGSNSYTKTHPIQAHFAQSVGLPAKEYLHAEIHAILKAGAKKIHSIKILKHLKTGDEIIQPCPVCFAAIKANGIKYIHSA